MAGKDMIMLHQRELKRLHVIHKVLDETLNLIIKKEITTRPEKQQKPARKLRQRKGHTPAVNHPWRKSNYQLFGKRQNRREKLIEVAA